MAFFRAFLMSVFCAMVSLPAIAGVGSVDSREYVNWADYPQIVHLKMHDSNGSGIGGYGCFCRAVWCAP